MGGHAAAEPVRIRHDRFHLFERILRGVRVVAFRKHSARGTDLDDVRAILDDFANLVLHRLDAVGHSFSLKMKCGREQIFVAMTAGDSQRWSRGDHARPNHVSIVDGIAQCDVRIIFRANVAHCSESCFEGAPRVSRAMQRFTSRRNPKPLIPERVQVKREMGMHVDQAGQQRGVRQINGRVSGSRLDFAGRRDLRNLFPFNDDGQIRAQLSRAHVEYSAGANHRSLRCLRLRASCRLCSRQCC